MIHLLKKSFSRSFVGLAVCCSALALVQQSEAAMIAAPSNITGNHQFSGWGDVDVVTFANAVLTHSTATNPWASALNANQAGSNAGMTFNKTSGGGYVTAPGGMGPSMFYTTHLTGGSFEIADALAISNLANVVFALNSGIAPHAVTLSYNGGSQALAPVIQGVEGQVYTLQWDLRALSGVTNFTINWSIGVAGNPGSFHALRVDQTDSFTAVPEPSRALLLVAGVGLLLARRKRPARRQSFF